MTVRPKELKFRFDDSKFYMWDCLGIDREIWDFYDDLAFCPGWSAGWRPLCPPLPGREKDEGKAG